MTSQCTSCSSGTYFSAAGECQGFIPGMPWKDFSINKSCVGRLDRLILVVRSILMVIVKIIQVLFFAPTME